LNTSGVKNRLLIGESYDSRVWGTVPTANLIGKVADALSTALSTACPSRPSWAPSACPPTPVDKGAGEGTRTLTPPKETPDFKSSELPSLACTRMPSSAQLCGLRPSLVPSSTRARRLIPLSWVAKRLHARAREDARPDYPGRKRTSPAARSSSPLAVETSSPRLALSRTPR
jgi:hypothetical protein